MILHWLLYLVELTAAYWLLMAVICLPIWLPALCIRCYRWCSGSRE